jgi:chromosome segregation ATPase
MTYGYQQGGSFGSHKQALGFDAGASEQMRAAAAMRERERVEKDRAKQQLKDVQSKLEHNKTEISHKEIEARRLIAEITHSMHELQEAERAVKLMGDKEHTSKIHITDTNAKIQDTQKQEILKKKELETLNHEAEQLEKQIALLQQKVNDHKRHAADMGIELQKLSLNIKQLESEENKGQSDVSHVKSEALYKAKELDTKKRAIQTMDQKRMREIGEIERLKTENIHLENEARQLEIKAK